MDPIIRTETLFDGLNAHEKRRLYFLLLGIDQLELREALTLAERIDTFITAEASLAADATEAPLPAGRWSHPVARSPEKPDGESLPSGEPQPQPDQMPSSPPRLRLNKPSQIAFFKAVARGATNAELAEAFGLTKRQAQAIRIGMARRRARGAPTHRQTEGQATGGSTASSVEPSAATACEISTPAATGAVSEVVRFLRQVGDVVVKQGDVFVVNSILRMSFEELVGRANAKRLQRGKSAFDIPARDANPRFSANGNGLEVGSPGRDATDQPA
jgi:hypothetical protein